MSSSLLRKALLGLAACAVAFFITLGVIAVLPPAVQDTVPPGVLGGAVVVLGVTTARRFTRRAR